MGDSWQSTHNDTGPSRDREKPRPRRMCAGSNHTSHETKGCPRVLTELRPETWTRLMVAVMRLPVGPDPGILPGSGP